MKIFWIAILNILVIGAGATKGCLFSNSEVDELKNEVRDFLKGITVADNKINSAVGLVTKAKSLANSGMSATEVQAVMAADVTRLSTELHISEDMVQKAIVTHVNESHSTSKNSTKTTVGVRPNLDESTVTDKDSAKTYLNGLQDNQLIFISGDIIRKIEQFDSQIIVDHVNNKSVSDAFVKTVVSTKEILLSNYNEYKKILDGAQNRLHSGVFKKLVSDGESTLSNVTNTYSKHCYTNARKNLPTYQGQSSQIKSGLQDEFETNAKKVSNCINEIDEILEIKRDILYIGTVTDLTTLRGHLNKLHQTLENCRRSPYEIHSALTNIPRNNTDCSTKVTEVINSKTSAVQNELTIIKKFLREHTNEMNNSFANFSDTTFTVHDEIGKIKTHLSELITKYNSEITLLTNRISR